MEKVKAGVTKEKEILTGEKRVSKYALERKPAEYLLSEEVAREQLMLLLTYYDIDLGRIPTDDDKGAEALSMSERTFDAIVDYIRLGKLEMRRDAKEKVEVVHTLENGTAVIYGELGAPAKLAMDKCPPEAQYARRYALMGSLSSVGSEGIQKFKARDLAIAEVLGMLFMSV